MKDKIKILHDQAVISIHHLPLSFILGFLLERGEWW